MPTYEYRCNACGHELETFQKMAEAPLRECPACAQPELERLISASAFQLKGGGWAKDAYGSGKSRSEKQVTDRLQKAVNSSKTST